MFSQTAEYALRAVVCLAQHEGGPLPAATIAELTRSSPDYLAKVLQLLTKADIVLAKRGLRGGYALRLPAAQISVLTVVNAVDPIKRITACPLGLVEHGTQLCSLHRMLDDAMMYIENLFGNASIETMITQQNMNQPLCASGNFKREDTDPAGDDGGGAKPHD